MARTRRADGRGRGTDRRTARSGRARVRRGGGHHAQLLSGPSPQGRQRMAADSLGRTVRRLHDARRHPATHFRGGVLGLARRTLCLLARDDSLCAAAERAVRRSPWVRAVGAEVVAFATRTLGFRQPPTPLSALAGSSNYVFDRVVGFSSCGPVPLLMRHRGHSGGSGPGPEPMSEPRTEPPPTGARNTARWSSAVARVYVSGSTPKALPASSRARSVRANAAVTSLRRSRTDAIDSSVCWPS